MLRSYIFLIIYIQFITVIVPKNYSYIPFYYSVYQSIDDPPIPIFSSEIYQPAMYVFQAENLGIWWGYDGDHISTMGSVLG